MALPQGLISYPGLEPGKIINASFTMSHGASPSSCILTAVPSPSFTPKIGRLVISYGPNIMTFPSAAVESTTLNVTDAGHLLTVKILDRRWAWAYGEISADFNTRDHREQIISDNRASALQMSEELLKAMGEDENTIVNDMPEDVFPEAHWRVENPARALESLCQSLGCRIILGLDNRVRIRRLNQGSQLPKQNIINEQYGFKSPIAPEEIKLVCGETIFDSTLELEAVGKDLDGQIKPLAECTKLIEHLPEAQKNSGLTYRGEPFPWAFQNPDSMGGLSGGATDPDTNLPVSPIDFARNTFYKMYRPVSQQTIDLNNNETNTNTSFKPFGFPGDFEVTQLSQILPLERTRGLQYSRFLGKDDEKLLWIDREASKPKVSGVWFHGDQDRPNQVYPFPVQIDVETGIVTFRSTMYKRGRTLQFFLPADLTLGVSYKIRGYNNIAHRHSVTRRLLEKGTSVDRPHIVLADDLVLNYEVTSNEDGLPVLSGTNTEFIESEAEKYLDAEVASFQLDSSYQVHYAGLYPIELDGLTHQVTWTTDESGAFTTVSVNDEHDFTVPSFSDRAKAMSETRYGKKEARLDKREARIAARNARRNR